MYPADSTTLTLLELVDGSLVLRDSSDVGGVVLG
jgi:hypothetical protein